MSCLQAGHLSVGSGWPNPRAIAHLTGLPCSVPKHRVTNSSADAQQKAAAPCTALPTVQRRPALQSSWKCGLLCERSLKSWLKLPPHRIFCRSPPPLTLQLSGDRYLTRPAGRRRGWHLNCPLPAHLPPSCFPRWLFLSPPHSQHPAPMSMLADPSSPSCLPPQNPLWPSMLLAPPCGTSRRRWRAGGAECWRVPQLNRHTGSASSWKR